MFKKQNYIIFFIAAVLLILVVSITFFSLTGSPTQTQEEPTPSPTSSFPIPTETEPPQLQSDPPVEYDTSSQEKLLNKFQNRESLVESDEQAKQKMLSLLPAGESSGTLYRTSNVNIDYLSGPNIFQVEILTTNVEPAKNEAIGWFKSQGFSQNAICNYPVQFYLNFDIANELRDKNIIFNPLAEGC